MGKPPRLPKSKTKSTERASPPGERGVRPRRAWTLALACIWIVGLTLALYGRTWSFVYTDTDDALLITDNAGFLTSLRNVPAAFRMDLFGSNTAGESYYRPVVTTTYILDAQWEGANPRPYHITNVLLHAVASILLLIALSSLLRGAGPSTRIATDEWLALGGASLFVVHPALTEAVAWIPGRCDSLLAIWAFSATIAILQFLRTGHAYSLTAHAVFALLALLTKETAVVLPVLFSTYIILVDRRPTVLRDRRLWVAWTIPICLWLLLRITTPHSATDVTIATRLGIATNHFGVLFMQLGKVLLPYKLSPLAFATDTPAAPGVATAIAAVFTARKLQGRCLHLFLWGIIGFVLFLAPTLLVSDFLILESRLYLPTACLLISLVAVAQYILDVPIDEVRPRVAGVAVVTATSAILLGFAASKYTSQFQDPSRFTEAAVRESPHSPLAHLNFGSELYRNHKLDEAGQQFDEAIRLDESQAVAHNDRGLVYMNRGQPEVAEREFRRELEINPRYDKAYYNLGLALRMMGRPAEALESFQHAVELNPAQIIPPPEPVASVEVSPRDIPDDIFVELYEEGLRREPANLVLRRKFAELCRSRGLTCAREQYAILLQMNPGDIEARRILAESE